MHVYIKNLIFPALALLLVATAPAMAQAPVADEAGVNILESLGGPDAKFEEILTGVAALSDAEIRQILLTVLRERFDANAARAATPGAVESPTMAARIDAVQQRLKRVAGGLPEIRTIPAQVRTWVRESGGAALLIRAVLLAIATFVVAYLAERLAEVRVRRKLQADGVRVVRVRVARFNDQCGRLLTDMARMMAFAAVSAMAVVLVWQGLDPYRGLFINIAVVVVAVRFADFMMRFAVLPGADGHQLIALEPVFAARIVKQLTVLIGVLGLVFILNRVITAAGVAPTTMESLSLVVGTVVLLVFARFVLVARAPLAALFRGARENAGPLRRIAAASWHLLALLYLGFVYASALVSDPETLSSERPVLFSAIASIVVVLAVPFLDAFFGAMVDAWKASARDEDVDESKPERLSLLDVVHRVTRVALIVAGIGLIAKFWNIDLIAGTENTVGDSFAGAMLSIGITILLAYTLWLIVEVMLGRYDGDEGDGGHVDAGGEGGGAGATRVETVMPLVRRFFHVTIVVISAMIILSALGMNIGPLIAGAGVVGLAIGFGAQTLVTDVISGLFYLLDDAFRTGEYVDIGDVKGRVEKMNVRSLVLRHHRGALNTVPYSEIKHLKNYSRDWVIMKLVFRVTYDTDVNQVKKIFKKIGQELLEDPVLGEGFIEPFKSQGVLSMEDSAMIVRGKFMARPGEQFMIRKEIYNRVQKAFDEAGIKFAHRRVAVDMLEADGSKQDLSDVTSAAAAAATATAETAP